MTKKCFRFNMTNEYVFKLIAGDEVVSSHDVAKLAGVSQSTVSRVLNGSSLVKPETVEKVEKAMKELQFRPNLVARSLVKNKTNTIALISEHLYNPFYVETTDKIVNIAAEKGYNVLVYFHFIGDDASLYQTVLSHRVEGIVMSSILIDDPIYSELEDLNIPFVTFNRKHRKGGNYIELNNGKAAELAVDHLAALGHRRIAYIGGPLHASTFYDRHEGYKEAMRRRGLKVLKPWIKMTDTREESIKAACGDLIKLRDSERPTAMIAATDAIALECLDYLHKAGIRVPEQMSLCGMDNIKISAHHAIQLTTIGAISAKNMGELAIERLIAILEQEEERPMPERCTLEPILINRKTTARIP
ncbi:LacI family transcriptional regulator [Paenibacillus contaminans]|uniref:LacI family transcriptional regulator n=1 Tax=Paenibacillus contaminans TaxID=450362 RepID=A0A329MZY0_9BACL|nr:LacI family transcriptional regulator [Paenibacillus contaminans]